MKLNEKSKRMLYLSIGLFFVFVSLMFLIKTTPTPTGFSIFEFNNNNIEIQPNIDSTSEELPIGRNFPVPSSIIEDQTENQIFQSNSGSSGPRRKSIQEILDEIEKIHKYNQNRTFNISLIAPLSGFFEYVNSSLFEFKINSSNSLNYCELIINNEIVLTNYNITSNNIHSFNLTSLLPKRYTWQISCKDNKNNTLISEKRWLIFVKSSRFSGETTNLNNVDIEKIQNFIIESPSYGKISFLENINLSEGADIDANVIVEKNKITINSKNITALNKTARLTFYDLNLVNPVIFRDGEYCSNCQIISNNANLSFLVPHFSTYTASENSKLHIFDDSDSNIKNINEIINFYANYTNITNDIPISGASCTIYFTDGSESMTFNSGLFKYNRSFSSIGIKNYNVTCDGSAQGFTALSTNEYASINFDNSPNGANITEISNERGTFALSTPSTILESGNLTFFNFDSNVLTNSWQAYYGNITGGIKLESASGAVFYQWEILDPSGEVYAARVSDINFATLNCTNSTQISTEESYIGHLSAAADSVTNTFDSATHPNFTIGEQFYDENLCFATNMYSNSVQSNNFFEVLLSDAANNIVYTTIIENNKLGFDNTPYHFQMLVGENGQDSIGTSYYFFVEVE